jgi:peroxisomal 3,2-trans-enoyl-CoA isomerase
MAPPIPPTTETLETRLIPINNENSEETGYVAVFLFNRPQRANALSPNAYIEWLTLLRWAAKTDAVYAVVLNGKGKFYCSGQELVLAQPTSQEAFEADLKRACKVTEDLVDAFIDFPKLLVAAVNGPCYGFGATHLTLCDVVYVTPDASMKTPFMELGFCAEGCSSYMFPK